MNLKRIDLSTPSNLAFVRLVRCQGLGSERLKAILKEFGQAEAALEAIETSSHVRGRYKVSTPPTWEAVNSEIDKMAKIGAFFLGYNASHSTLPEDFPPLLAAIGNTELLTQRKIAIVGSRRASLAGLTLTAKLAHELSIAGLIVVSGLARGVDSCAHKASLMGGTIAVIANGLDVTYPAENRALQAAIAQEGLLLTQMPLGCFPSRHFFPKRNHIIATLSLGTLVVEAHTRSGSLMTARLARARHKQVWAVPGSPLDPLSGGPNLLIKEGAHLVESSQDILASLGLKANSLLPPFKTPHTVLASHPFLHLLSVGTSVSLNTLMQESRLGSSHVRALLSELELEGKIVQDLSGIRLAPQ